MLRRKQDPQLRQLNGHLGALRRQIWTERVTHSVTRALAIGFGLALVVAVVAWFMVLQVATTYYGGLLAAALGLALLISLFRYPSMMETARLADRRLHLEERLGTAVELARTGSTGPLNRLQLRTAVHAAGWARRHWRGDGPAGRDLSLALALGMLATGVVLLTSLEGRLPTPIPRPSIWSLLPGEQPTPEGPVATDQPPAPAAAAPRPAVAASAPGARTANVARTLDDVRRGRESGSLTAQDARTQLAQAESELTRITQASRAQREAIDRLGRALDQVAAGRPAAEAIQRGDYERAGQEIEALGIESDQLSPEAKAQLSQALRAAAAESGATPDLAARERRAGDAMAGRDYEATRRAMADLGADVSRRGNEVVPQSEIARAWGQVNDERRSQGQAEAPASAQQGGQPGGQQASQAPRQGSGSGSGAGTEAGGGGGDEGASGNGNGGSATAQAPGPPPDQQPVGEFQPAGQAARLDVQGRPVQVDVRPGNQGGPRPGEAGAPDGQQSDEVGTATAVSGDAPRRITSAAPAESNFVPNDRRQVVREYFSGQGAR